MQTSELFCRKMEKITNKSKCNLCDEELDQNGLQIHYVTCHEKITSPTDGKQKKYKCDSCDKLFSTKKIREDTCQYSSQRSQNVQL